jgi:hypothetical protein
MSKPTPTIDHGALRQALDRAFLEGRSAFNAGVVVGDNPHPETDKQHDRWMSGWAVAADTARRRRYNRRFNRVPRAQAKAVPE